MTSVEILLPPVPTGRKHSWEPKTLTGLKKSKKFLTRLLRVDHMDFEFAFWQMIYLFTSPSKIYRNVYYRKQTKNQYSRDDPAFLVLLSFWFIISATGLSLVLQLPFFAFVKFLFWVIFVDCIGIGFIVATCLWFVSNRYLRKDPNSREDVEWGFAFDVHLNAFFPPLLIIHVFQLVFFNVFINRNWFVSKLFGNTLCFISTIYYIYITFLGYSSLPNLHRTQVLLYPLVLLLLFYLVTMCAGINVCRLIMEFYHYRVY